MSRLTAALRGWREGGKSAKRETASRRLERTFREALRKTSERASGDLGILNASVERVGAGIDQGAAGIATLQARVEELNARVAALEVGSNTARDLLPFQSNLTRLLLDDLLLSSPRYADEKRLLRANAQVYSQNYEDAMIADICSRIGATAKRFVEIGTEDGSECCTRFLLELCGFSGVWVEMNPEMCDTIRRKYARYIADGRLILVEKAVTVANVNDIIPAEYRDVDVLSIDIDQNTSHVWRALDIRSRIACIEYNSAFPPSLAVEVDYVADRVWDGSNVSGASLKSIEEIGVAKGMSLVGCDLHGVNAFLVGNGEDLSQFRAPFTAANHFEPMRLELVRRRGHPRRTIPV